MATKRKQSAASRANQKRRELIRALKQVARQLGPNVTLLQFQRRSGISRCHVYTYFDSWGDLREQAGLNRYIDRSDNIRYSREDVLQAMREAIEVYGPGVRFVNFQSHSHIAHSVIDRLFGSWRELRQAAGLDPDVRPGLARRYTWDDLIARLKQLASERGDVTEGEFCRDLDASKSIITSQGSWAELRRAAGLPKVCQKGKPKWLRELIAAIPNPAELVDEPPADDSLQGNPLPCPQLTPHDVERVRTELERRRAERDADC